MKILFIILLSLLYLFIITIYISIGLWKTPYGREYLHEFALKERAAIVGRNRNILW